MKTRNRKWLAVLCAGLTAAMLLSSCAGKPASPDADSSQGSPAGSTGESSQEEVKTHKVSVMFRQGKTYVNPDEFNEFPVWQEFQKQMAELGLEVSFEQIMKDQYDIALQTRFAAKKDLPDLAYLANMDDASVLSLAENGLIIDVDEAIAQYSNGNIKAMCEKYFPFDGATAVTPDGHRYWLSDLKNLLYYADGDSSGEGIDCNYVISNAIRKDWLDKFDLDMPTTIDEYVNALRTFREQDANGNGQKDEAMMFDPYSYNFYTGIAQWYGLPPALLAPPIGIDAYNEKVVCAWDQPGCKPYFELMRQLTEEGLFDLTMVNATDEQCNQRIAENRVSACRAYSDGLDWESLINPDDPLNGPENYILVPPLRAVEGVQPYALLEPAQMSFNKYVITSECQDVEGVIKLLDWVFTEEADTLLRRGVEGTDFMYETDPAIKGTMEGSDYMYMDENGEFRHVTEKEQYPAIKAEDAYAKRVGFPLANLLGQTAFPRTMADPQYYGTDNPKIAMKQQSQIDQMQTPYYFPSSTDNYYAIATDEETEILNKYTETLTSRSQEVAMKLIIGEISLDDFDKEVQSLKTEYHMDDVLAVYQARYERAQAALSK